MDLKEAQDTFAVRLYEWSLRDFRREMASGCPLLSMVGLTNRPVAAFVTWARGLVPGERQTLANALVRKARAHAAGLRGETLSPEAEQRWNQGLLNPHAVKASGVGGVRVAHGGG